MGIRWGYWFKKKGKLWTWSLQHLVPPRVLLSPVTQSSQLHLPFWNFTYWRHPLSKIQAPHLRSQWCDKSWVSFLWVRVSNEYELTHGILLQYNIFAHYRIPGVIILTEVHDFTNRSPRPPGVPAKETSRLRQVLRSGERAMAVMIQVGRQKSM